MFSGLFFKNPGEIRDNLKSVRGSWENTKSREPPDESGRVGNYENDFKSLSRALEKTEVVISKNGNSITFVVRYFQIILFFITRVNDRWKIILVFSGKRKIALEKNMLYCLCGYYHYNYSANWCSTKNSLLLRRQIFMMLLPVPQPLKLLKDLL